ncbi:hypothetical protein SAY87_003586 [Trapa incisa]|uniref:Pentatricopeptide repeat superfamily protein n=1 Tax=Trapa incisa TaxID=236973 RepID=A0AAN7KRM7_9MYRT|nr:hypothetical protein SAY87_003586 [Trapa incisa]
MNLLQSVAAGRTSLLRVLRRRHFSQIAASPSEELSRRNYANNISEYNTVVTSISSQRRYFLLRDVYDDMMLDGLQPTRDVFHSLIMGTMRGSRLQDAFFFRDQMKSMGLIPDLALYNFLISTCGKCKSSDRAIQIFEEMKKYGVKPNGQTYVCLLNACAAGGRSDQVMAIVRDMTANGVALNKFCYSGLIIDQKNKIPTTDDTVAKIIELVEQSKGWSAEGVANTAENSMLGVSEEELYNMPTAEYVFRRGIFLNRQLTIYHAAFHACADLRNVAATETLLEMLKNDGKTADVFIVMQVMRCYLHSGDLDKGLKTFEEYMESGKPPTIDLYVTLIEGAMVGYTPRGMDLAQETLTNMNSRNFFLSPRMGSDLLLAASGEKTGGFTTANYIWDMMRARKITPTLPAVEAYYKGLKDREIPEDDPRLFSVSKIYDDLRLRTGGPRQRTT